MTTVFTYNIDWAKSNEKERISILSILEQANVVCWQEAKHIDIDRAIPGVQWATHQNVQDHAKQGVGVSWLRPGVKRFLGPTPKNKKKNWRHAGYVLGTGPRGLRMLPRYINYRDLVLEDGRAIRFISTHRPPKRYQRLWGYFDRSLAAFVKRSPLPVVLGMDSNIMDHAAIEKKTGLVWHGFGIDGFLVDKSIKVSNLKQHPKAQSDHHPVSIDI